MLVFAASVLLQVILLAAVWGVGKVVKLNEVETTSIYYSNSGNLIVPLVTFILGKEWVLYGCVFMSVQLVFLWTHGKNTISREGKWDWKKIVFNINMISVFAGVVLFFTRIRLPEIVNQTLSSVGSMIGPASMIVTGMLIAEMNLKSIFENVKVYFISFLRLVVIPGDIIDDFKDKRACEHTFGRKEITAYRISCGDHTVCFNDHTDVSGVWK